MTFDDWHFCFVPLLVHSALLEYKLRASSPAIEQERARFMNR